MTDWVRRGLVAILATLAVAGGWFLPGRLVMTATPSVDGVLFWRAGSVEAGRYVMLPPHSPCPKDLPLLKQAVCGPGEWLFASQRWGVLCEGYWLGRAKNVARDGRDLFPFLWDGPVPEGKWYVAGTHKDSCDSRYFGFVAEAEMTPVVKLW